MSSKKDLDNLLQGFVDGGLPGCGLKVTQRGETLYEGYFGYQDIENKIPVSETTLFRQASMSKLPLYTTAMMLYEQGKFNITDPVGDYIEEYKESKKWIITPTGRAKAVPTDKPMTIQDVLSMKCGMPYCYWNNPTRNQTMASMQKCMEPLWAQGNYTLQEHVRAMGKAVLAFEPGTHWIYGFSSEITAALIEVWTGLSIDEAFKKYIYEPLGMTSTKSKLLTQEDKDRLCKMYDRKDNTLTLNPKGGMLDATLDPNVTQGWARLISTVDDYSRLMSMLACGGKFEGKQIMDRKTIDMMRSNGLDETMQKEFDNDYLNGYGYGYGVRTITDRAKGNLLGSYGSFGWTGGNGTWCESDPEDGVAIVYMHNMNPTMELYYHHRVRNVAYALIR